MRTVLLTGALLILGFGFLVSVNGQAQTPGTLPGTAAEPQSLDRATAAPSMTDIHDIKPLEPVPMGKTWLLYLLAGLAALLLLAGLAGLPLGADLLVDGASNIASAMGVSDAVIGLTLVALALLSRATRCSTLLFNFPRAFIAPTHDRDRGHSHP